ncbi:MAG TPA: hypothetical protein VLT57_18440 [Bryobacteraceae bacterium]|nr:hypothetical protein [Bryobacteraceae bacterium]
MVVGFGVRQAAGDGLSEPEASVPAKRQCELLLADPANHRVLRIVFPAPAVSFAVLHAAQQLAHEQRLELPRRIEDLLGGIF